MKVQTIFTGKLNHERYKLEFKRERDPIIKIKSRLNPFKLRRELDEKLNRFYTFVDNT